MSRILFNRNLGVRDSSNLTIRSIIIILNLESINNYLSNIPIIKSNEQATLYYPIITKFSISFDRVLHKNKTKAFISH